MQFWLLKTEPHEYSWKVLKKETSTAWDGVRNFEARNNMKKMQLDDLAFFYHTGAERQIEGLVKVSKTYYEDALDNNFGNVDVTFYKEAKVKLTLNNMKNIAELQNIILLKRGRLSVAPITETEAKYIINNYF